MFFSQNSHRDDTPRMTLPPPNTATGNIFYKTRTCTKFSIGTCRSGKKCNFAHGVEELRHLPPNWKELVGPRNKDLLQQGNQDEDRKIIHKMNLCKKYCNGEECPYGDKCRFLHEDLAMFRDNSWESRECSAITIGTIGSNNLKGSRAVNKQARGIYWKTKLCHKWQHTGNCPFGKNCRHAHGEAELQVPGEGIEAEAAVAIASSTNTIIPTLPNALSVSANDAPITSPASLPVAKEEEQQPKMKRILGLKFSQINRIYGDWIDD